MSQLTLTPIPGIPEIKPGNDLGVILCQGIIRANIKLQKYDIIAIAQKVVSKAENRFVSLATVTPSNRALEIAETTAKDPRLVELILQESAEISRMKKGVLITRHRLGFVSANSGIDRSNVPQENGDEQVLLLPKDPDQSATNIRETIFQQLGTKVGVIITDTHGRPHRLGAAGVAIGAAGVPTILNKKGALDRDGRMLQATSLAIGDELAAAASLLMGAAAESRPVIHVRGLSFEGNGKASDQYRPPHLDLYA